MKNLSLISSGLGTSKAINIDTFFDYLEQVSDGEGRARENYGQVAWVFRAVNLRASSVSRIPYTITKNDSPYEWKFPLRRLMRTIESDICLRGGGVILKKESITKLKGLQRLNPWTIVVEKDSSQGIKGFRQKTGSGKEDRLFTPEQIIYFDHLYHPNDDLGFGIAPAQVAGLSGKLVRSMSEYANNYFENGAIPAVVLETEHGVKQSQAEEVKTLWQKTLQGVRNAWRTIVLQKGLKAHVIGNPTKDLAMPELEASAKKQIAIAFGIPMGLLEQQDVSHATAEAHHSTFWTDTVIPEAELLAEKLNEDLFEPLGLEFVYNYEELESIQAIEFKKAQGLSALLREANQAYANTIIDLEEARMIYQVGFSRLGFKEAADALKDEIKPELVKKDEKEEPPEQPPPKNEDNKGIDPKKALGAAPKEVYRELARWRKTAPNKGKDFDSEILPGWLQEQTKAIYDLCGHEGAFGFLKQANARMIQEEILRNELESVLKAQERAFHQYISDMQTESQDDWLQRVLPKIQEEYFPQFIADLEKTIKPRMSAIMGQSMMDVSMGMGVAFDPAVVNTRAAEKIKQFSSLLTGQLGQTTKEAVQSVIGMTIETPGMTLEDAARLLRPTFSDYRAELIAVTETTRAYSLATNEVQSMLAGSGIEMTRVWNTGADELVCPVCRPLDRAPEKEWLGSFPEGAPAHPHCRCVVTLSALPEHVLDDRYKDRQDDISRWMDERERIARQASRQGAPITRGAVDTMYHKGQKFGEMKVSKILSSYNDGSTVAIKLELEDKDGNKHKVQVKPSFTAVVDVDSLGAPTERFAYELAYRMGYEDMMPYTEYVTDQRFLDELIKMYPAWDAKNNYSGHLRGVSLMKWVDDLALTQKNKNKFLPDPNVTGGRVGIFDVFIDPEEHAKMRLLDVGLGNWDRHFSNWGFYAPKDAKGNWDLKHQDFGKVIMIDHGYTIWNTGGHWGGTSYDYFFADKALRGFNPVAPSVNLMDRDKQAMNHLPKIEYARLLSVFQDSDLTDEFWDIYGGIAPDRKITSMEGSWNDHRKHRAQKRSLEGLLKEVSRRKYSANEPGLSSEDDWVVGVKQMSSEMNAIIDNNPDLGLLPRHFFVNQDGDLEFDENR